MKKFLFIVLIFFSFCFAKPINRFNWDVFIKTHNKEKFAVNFPKDPFTLSYDLLDIKNGGLFIKSSDGEIDYTVTVAERYDLDTKMILMNILKYLEKFPISIENFSFSENEKENILDISFKDKVLLVLYKARVIVTKNNIYTLFTSYKEGMNEKHGFFTSSFHIASS